MKEHGDGSAEGARQKKRSGTKTKIFVGLSFGFLILVIVLIAATSGETPDEASEPTNPIEAAVTKALSRSNRDVPRVLSAGLAMTGGQVTIEWSINDNLTGGLVKLGARMDVVDILEAVSKAGQPYETVTLLGSFPMTDTYGNTKELVVVRAQYTRATISRINWDSFLSDNAYLIAESATIHPEFQP